MNQTHTPGPWTADEAGYIEHAGGWGVAKAYGSNPTCAANAALIAAAPDLLRVCEKLVQADSGPFPRPAWLAPIVDAARAAIAKAKGGAA